MLFRPLGLKASGSNLLRKRNNHSGLEPPISDKHFEAAQVQLPI